MKMKLSYGVISLNSLRTGFDKIVQYLIDKHADINIADKNGRSPLYAALKEGIHIDIIRIQ